LIRKWGTAPLFVIGFCPIAVYLLKRPQPLVIAVAYIVLLTALLNGIITVYGREQRVHAD